ncbi:MAG TPA: FtsX-like permease family protein [Steroidobacteraceae bacterium]
MTGELAVAGLRLSWQVLTRAQWRERPLSMIAAAAAIALGVALGSAVFLINAAALAEFDQAARRLIGSADVVVRGAPEGFDEKLYVQLAHDSQVAAASPMLELDLTLPARRAPLKLMALDVFRAGSLQPALAAALGADITGLFARDTIALSRAAAQRLRVQRADFLPVLVGDTTLPLRVVAILPDSVYPEALGIMDIATAQWSFERVGHINRIDLQLRAGVSPNAFGSQLARRLPPGVVAVSAPIEQDRAVSATRAYRVNLEMLALVALLTGAFLVFSTQSLAVLRRRQTLGLLRALGVTRAQLRRALLAEGAALGLAGSVIGCLLGALLAGLVLHSLGGGLGNRALSTGRIALAPGPLEFIAFLAIGTLTAGLGAWLPAREAVRRSPALALKAGDVEPALRQLSTARPGLTALALGALLAYLPSVRGVPVAGYLSIAAVLAGAVLLLPYLLRRLLRGATHTGHVPLDTAIAQLAGSAALSSVSLGTIVVSFSLMVAMAIMVHSFRSSFDLWLARLLPADVQLLRSVDSDTGSLSAQQQQRIAQLPDVERVQFRRVRELWLRQDRPPVALIARDIDAGRPGDSLPLVGTSTRRGDSASQTVWVSEAMQDRYGYRPGDSLQLPIDGQLRPVFVAGVWRDYVRPDGAIVISRADYIVDTGDTAANEASIWTRPPASAAMLTAEIRAALNLGEGLELSGSDQLRARSLRLFDRTFAVTYALEAVAVLIGLVGIAVATSSLALARRAQFGMLRHLGMLRRQIVSMLAIEGLLMSAVSVCYGLLLGSALSLILVYVVNRQSFHWSIDLIIPWGQLAVLGLGLMATAALSACWSGRAATSQTAIRAVREDW